MAIKFEMNTNNKIYGSLIGLSFEMPNAPYSQHCKQCLKN